MIGQPVKTIAREQGNIAATESERSLVSECRLDVAVVALWKCYDR